MADETQGYGYSDDEVKVSPFNFGLNAGTTFLTKFEWTPTGGKDGAEQEALDIVFTINKTEKSYKLFPVTKAFIKGGGETTDPTSQEFKDSVADFNGKVTHIMSCFIDKDSYRAALSRKIESFKDFCTLVKGLLPKGFETKPLDIFMQFQYQMSEGQTRTYLEIPKNMKHGKWLVPAQAGTWTKHQVENPSDDVREALFYTNEKGDKHPFIRTGWFVNSNFSKQQKEGSDSEQDTDTTTSKPADAAQNQSTGVTQSW